MTQSRKRAFTLMEVLVSASLLLVVVLFVVGTLTKALAGMQKSSDSSAGLMVCHSILDSRIQTMLTDDVQRDNFFTAPSGSWESGTGALLDGTEYKYDIDVADVVPAAGALKAGNRLRRVRVVVWWWNADKDDNRPGFGRLRSELVRLVNEKSRK